MPMDVMTSGVTVRLRQASQAASMMSSKVSKTQFDSQLPRRYCQTFSTGLGFRGARGQPDRREVGRKNEVGRGVPAGSVEDQYGMSADGDVGGDFFEVELHRLGVGEGRRQRRTGSAGGTDPTNR